MDWSNDNTLYRVLGHSESISVPPSISHARGMAERALERMASTTPNLPPISPIREQEQVPLEATLDFSDLMDWGTPTNLDNDEVLIGIINSAGRSYDQQPPPPPSPHQQPPQQPPQQPLQQPAQEPPHDAEVVPTVAEFDGNTDLKILPNEDVSRMNQSELMEYFHNLRDFEKNTAADTTTLQRVGESIAFVRQRLIWRAPHTTSYMRSMNMNQLIGYLGELQRIDQQDYLQSSRDRINHTIDLVKNQIDVFNPTVRKIKSRTMLRPRVVYVLVMQVVMQVVNLMVLVLKRYVTEAWMQTLKVALCGHD